MTIGVDSGEKTLDIISGNECKFSSGSQPGRKTSLTITSSFREG